MSERRRFAAAFAVLCPPPPARRLFVAKVGILGHFSGLEDDNVGIFSAFAGSRAGLAGAGRRGFFLVFSKAWRQGRGGGGIRVAGPRRLKYAFIGILVFLAPENGPVRCEILLSSGLDESAGGNSPGGAAVAKQLLHVVIGGEVRDPAGAEFTDLAAIDIAGFYPDYASALVAWREKAQATVDNAMMRYFIVHMHRLLDPENEERKAPREPEPG